MEMQKDQAEKIVEDLEKLGYSAYIQPMADFQRTRRLHHRPEDWFDYIVVVIREPKE